METFINNTGGRPLKNEDAQLFEQLITMLEGLGEDIDEGLGVIMSGVEITGTPGNFDVTEGFIYYDG